MDLALPSHQTRSGPGIVCGRLKTSRRSWIDSFSAETTLVLTFASWSFRRGTLVRNALAMQMEVAMMVNVVQNEVSDCRRLRWNALRRPARKTEVSSASAG